MIFWVTGTTGFHKIGEYFDKFVMTTESQKEQLLQEMCFRDNIFILENIEKQIDMQNSKE